MVVIMDLLENKCICKLCNFGEVEEIYFFLYVYFYEY